MLGPFWCVESNAWLRFNVAEDGRVIAQMAVIDEHNHTLTSPWQPIAPTTWHVLNNELQHGYYHLADGVLYRLRGKNVITGRVEVSRNIHLDDNWEREPSNPFADYLPSTARPADGFIFPLTPEQQTEQWQAFQRTDLFERIGQEIDSPFTMDQRAELISFAPLPLASNYLTYEAYLTELRAAIENEENQFHIQINQQASRTVDFQTLLDSPIDRNSLFLMKKRFYLELVAGIYNHIREQFYLPTEALELPITPPPPASRGEHAADQAGAPDHWQEDWEEPFGDFDAPAPGSDRAAIDPDEESWEADWEEQFDSNATPPASEEWQVIDDIYPALYPLVEGAGFHTQGIMNLVNSRLNPMHREDLLVRLVASMEGIFSQHYTLLSDYYNSLVPVIHDENNEYHQAIQAIAFDETNVDQDMNPTHDEERAAQLRQEKIDFLFNVLKFELRNIGLHIEMATPDAAIFGQGNDRTSSPDAQTQPLPHHRAAPIDETTPDEEEPFTAELETPTARSETIFDTTTDKMHEDNLLRNSLEAFQNTIQRLPEKIQQQLATEAKVMVDGLNRENPESAITKFQQNCNSLLQKYAPPSTSAIILKAVATVAITAAVTIIAAAIGFGIGFAAGLWTGPGAFISGVLTGAAATATIATSGAIGLGFGALSAYHFFKPQPTRLTGVAHAAVQDAVNSIVDKARENIATVI